MFTSLTVTILRVGGGVKLSPTQWQHFFVFQFSFDDSINLAIF